MVNYQRPEIAFLVQNILPLFASQFDYPLPEDEQNTKIDEIPIRIASSVKKPDVVYYYDGFPVFLIEAKKEGKSIEDAVDQALSYIRNYPVKTFSKNSVRPRFFAVTIGSKLFFMLTGLRLNKITLKTGGKIRNPLTFSELLEEYGLKKIERKEILTPEIFRKEVLNELGPLYKFEEKITPKVVKDVALQVLAFLQFGKDYTSHRPYIDLDKHKDRQSQIRRVYEKFDWVTP
jgi:type I site-specific restriction-modification system R (restriction) subunit